MIFTSESVTEGHPDKIADQISDAVLDAFLAKDPDARVACETLVTTGLVLVAGEISTSKDCYVDISDLARQTILDIGYDHARYGFDGKSCAVMITLDEQSRDIAQGVDKEAGDPYERLGAGDQGMMFGFACDETDAMMPMPIHLAHALAKRLSVVRKKGIVEGLGPDGKTQVAVRYKGTRPVAVERVLVSTQHHEEVDLVELRELILREVVQEALGELWEESLDSAFLFNPTGRFVVGGPVGDAGLTGRKIIVDTYGGYARHGGGAFSGKDPSKVDRSGAYMARHVAKNLVAAGLVARCEVQLAYAIGVSRPFSVRVDSFGSGQVSDDRLSELVQEVFDLRPAAYRDHLQLARPIYKPLAAYGQIGREGTSWEEIDHVEELRKGA